MSATLKLKATKSFDTDQGLTIVDPVIVANLSIGAIPGDKYYVSASLNYYKNSLSFNSSKENLNSILKEAPLSFYKEYSQDEFNVLNASQGGTAILLEIETFLLAELGAGTIVRI